MDVHLVDGTYELFRHFFAVPSRVTRDGQEVGEEVPEEHFFAVPSRVTRDGQEVGAVRAVLASMLGMLEDGATHVGIATDHVVESFRNDLYDGYKDGTGIDPAIASQFAPLEHVLESAGFRVLAMQEYEADDGLGSAARIAASDPRVGQVLICTPDKDLGQCVTPDARIIQFDRRKKARIDEAAVTEKFGVPPAAIPDYLGLVGDTADGFPGLRGWGAKSAATVLARYGRIEDIPADHEDWDVKVRGAAKLAATLRECMDDALLFRRIATIAYDAPTIDSVDELAWRGPRADFAETAEWLQWPSLVERARRLR